MLRIVSIAIVLMAVGCSQGDSTPPVSTAPDTGTESATPETPTGDMAAAEDAAADAGSQPASVQGCLDLVNESRYVEAIAPCTLAVQEAPDNQEVAAALAKAQADATGVQQAAAAQVDEAAAGAQQAATDQVDAAAAGVQGAADEQTQKLGDEMGKALQ